MPSISLKSETVNYYPACTLHKSGFTQIVCTVLPSLRVGLDKREVMNLGKDCIKYVNIDLSPPPPPYGPRAKKIVSILESFHKDKV